MQGNQNRPRSVFRSAGGFDIFSPGPQKSLSPENGERLFQLFSQSCFIALIFTPGPMVEAATQERMY